MDANYFLKFCKRKSCNREQLELSIKEEKKVGFKTNLCQTWTKPVYITIKDITRFITREGITDMCDKMNQLNSYCEAKVTIKKQDHKDGKHTPGRFTRINSQWVVDKPDFYQQTRKEPSSSKDLRTSERKNTSIETWSTQSTSKKFKSKIKPE